MSKVTVDLTPQQISHAIDQLPEGAKIEIAEKLQKFAVKLRIQRILKRVDQRKGARPSPRDVLKEIHVYRRPKHA